MKNLKNLQGVKMLNKKDQKEITGGFPPFEPTPIGGQVCNRSMPPCPAGFVCSTSSNYNADGRCIAL